MKKNHSLLLILTGKYNNLELKSQFNPWEIIKATTINITSAIANLSK